MASLPTLLTKPLSKLKSVFARLHPVTRGLIVIWAFWICFVHVLPAASSRFVFPHSPGYSHWLPKMRAVETPLSRWDSRWYFTIATEGYHYDGPDRESQARFYPLYPILMAATAWTTRLTPMWAGTVVSALALLGTLLLLARRAREDGGDTDAYTAVQALLFFPSAFVLTTVYSDSLALFFMVLAVALARRDRWWGAGLAGAGVALTRFIGFLALLPLFVLALRSWRTERRWRPLPGLLLTVAGAAAYPIYLWAKFGDPLIYFRFHTPGWAQHPRFFLFFLWDVVKAIVTVIGGGALPRSVQTMSSTTFPLNVAVLALLLWALIASARRRRWEETALVAGGFLLAISVGNLDGAIRYCLLYFPIFLRLGEVLAARPVVRSIAIPTLLAAQVMLVMQYANWWYVL
jgi:hypothetical protein